MTILQIKQFFWFLALILVVTRITTVIASHLSIRHQSRHGKRGSFRYLLLSLLLSILGLIPDSTLRPRRRATVISGGTRAFGPLQSPLRRRRRPEPLRRRPPHCCCGYGWGNCPGKLQWGGRPLESTAKELLRGRTHWRLHHRLILCPISMIVSPTSLAFTSTATTAPVRHRRAFLQGGGGGVFGGGQKLCDC